MYPNLRSVVENLEKDCEDEDGGSDDDDVDNEPNEAAYMRGNEPF
jgi:hypothetical protein